VGVARQYCGQLGKQDNCQVAVSLSLANHNASPPVAYQLYLPKEWAKDRTRRRKTGVPKEIRFNQTTDCARAATLRVRGRLAARRRADGRRLWRRYRSACHHHDHGVILRRRHYAEHISVGTRQGAAAGEDVIRSGTTAKTDPPGRHTSADFGQGARAQSSSACLAHDLMAGRQRPSGCLRGSPVCAFASPITIIG
jgi:hypothetical protein